MKNRMFARGLSARTRIALEAASLESGHWFKDLLGLWRANGTPSEATGLRLAVRDGYLNFYRCGQSVAKVGHNGKSLQLKVHAKYVASQSELGEATGYARLIGDQLQLAGRGEIGRYTGAQSLLAWIGVINAGYCRPDGEKTLIDGLLDCSQNANVIDLEMALPAWNDKERVAPRMDLVTLEDVRGRLKIIFGEVKVVTDGRIRSNSDGGPEVHQQLCQYRRYLAQPGHAEAIAHAYSATARDLIFLASLAQNVGNAISPSSEIVRAANGEQLDVAGEAVLVVHCGVPHSSDHWAAHRDRLVKERVQVREVIGSQPMNLGGLF